MLYVSAQLHSLVKAEQEQKAQECPKMSITVCKIRAQTPG